MTAMREVPSPTRGSGATVCCGGHRERCLFGHMHSWSTWYEGGKLQRTTDTFHCHVCGGVCTADEEDCPAESAGFDMSYLASRLPWLDDDDYLPEF